MLDQLISESFEVRSKYAIMRIFLASCESERKEIRSSVRDGHRDR